MEARSRRGGGLRPPGGHPVLRGTLRRGAGVSGCFCATKGRDPSKYEFEGSRPESALFSHDCPCGLAAPVRTAGLARRSPCGGAAVLTFASCSPSSTPTASVHAICRITLHSPGASPRLGCFLRCHPAISRRAGVVLTVLVKATQAPFEKKFRDFGTANIHLSHHVPHAHIRHRAVA